MLIISVLLGYRRLRLVKYYSDYPLVKRLLGVTRLSGVSTIIRQR